MGTLSRDSTYLELKSNIICKPECPEALKEMKTLFREDIRSNRAEDKIVTVTDLIKVLEKRDIISRDNIIPLREIYSILNKFIPHSPQKNSRAAPPEIRLPNHYYRSSRISCDPIVKGKVYETIALEIGRNWTTFARSLYLREGLIDDLHYQTNKERVYRILHQYEEDCDTRKWRSNLLKALIECRRKDLFEKVQLIFDTYNS